MGAAGSLDPAPQPPPSRLCPVQAAGAPCQAAEVSVNFEKQPYVQYSIEGLRRQQTLSADVFRIPTELR